jgi:hypothetical protein
MLEVNFVFLKFVFEVLAAVPPRTEIRVYEPREKQHV